MAKLNDTGVHQLTNKNWAFRYTITADGRKKDVRKAKDEFGNPLKTKTEAIRARNKAVEREREGKKPAPKVRKSFKEVYEEYCGNGRKDRAYRTKQKQDSLWNNHLCAKYGKRFVDEITAAEVNDYLSDLYYVEGFSYQYTEAFLKMFYLIFGQAYSRNYLEVDTYNKLCVNKDTRIKMPKMKTEDDTDIVAFSREELVLLDDYFKGTNAETAYLLGRYCGLRINEAFGLKWENVDLENGTIIIDRQIHCCFQALFHNPKKFCFQYGLTLLFLLVLFLLAAHFTFTSLVILNSVISGSAFAILRFLYSRIILLRTAYIICCGV